MSDHHPDDSSSELSARIAGYRDDFEVREPTILHVDMDCFFVAVEAVADPSLSGKPVIVGGNGRRGVVASCSYEARAYGVRSAMPSVTARRLCPHAIFLSGHYELYESYSRRMREILETFTPIVEGISIDEAFLDVSGARRLFGSPREIAESIRSRLLKDLGLHCSVGLATTKHLAKLASVAAKPRATPGGPVGAMGIVEVSESEAIEFLRPLPARALWGVGPKSAQKLAAVGILTVGQLADKPVTELTNVLGRAAAQHLHDLAWNLDPRPVVPDRGSKSVGHEQTYREDLHSGDAVHRQLVGLCDAVAARLRKANMVGRTVTLKVRFGDFHTITRSKTLFKPTANGQTMLSAADSLIDPVKLDSGIRLLGVSVSMLEPSPGGSLPSAAMSSQQLRLDDRNSVGNDTHRSGEVDDVVDRIRERFGDEAMVPAPLVGPHFDRIRSSGSRSPKEAQTGPDSSSPP